MNKRLISSSASFLIWFAAWAISGWLIGVNVGGHAWLIIPVQCAIHGFISGVLFVIFSVYRHRQAGFVSPARGVIYGAVAGLIPIAGMRLLVPFSLYVPLVVVLIDALLGAFLSLVLFRR